MNPIKFEGMNAVFTAPNCEDLPAFVSNGNIVITAWQLDEKDLGNIKKNGGVVFLVLHGQVPPLFLTTENPISNDK